jgi:hypothetical protein
VGGDRQDESPSKRCSESERNNLLHKLPPPRLSPPPPPFPCGEARPYAIASPQLGDCLGCGVVWYVVLCCGVLCLSVFCRHFGLDCFSGGVWFSVRSHLLVCDVEYGVFSPKASYPLSWRSLCRLLVCDLVALATAKLSPQLDDTLSRAGVWCGIRRVFLFPGGSSHPSTTPSVGRHLSPSSLPIQHFVERTSPTSRHSL